MEKLDDLLGWDNLWEKPKPIDYRPPKEIDDNFKMTFEEGYGLLGSKEDMAKRFEMFLQTNDKLKSFISNHSN